MIFGNSLNNIMGLVFRLVIPLTIISFFIITKWWYAGFDGSDEFFYGFPLPYTIRGFHTSLSLQIFIKELIIDLFTYFSIWLITLFIINKTFIKIKVHKIIAFFLVLIASLITTFSIFVFSQPNNIIYWEKPKNFELEIFETGYKFIWEEQFQPDYYKYHPEKEKVGKL